jgi:NitT/TauT family transport system substrate-binding protein
MTHSNSSRTPRAAVRRRPGWSTLAGLAITASLSLAACGGGSDDGAAAAAASAGSETAKPVKLRVSVVPGAQVAPLYVGSEKGFFRAEGLEVKPEILGGGASDITSILNGDMQFAFSNTVSLLVANSRGLPLQIVTPGSNGGTADTKPWNGVVVKAAGSVKRVEDLAGKTIAVNELNNIGSVTINAALRKRGVDTSGIKYIEVPFPDMNAALDAGRVDAVWENEPFITQALSDGGKLLLANYQETKPNLIPAWYFTSKPYAAKNKDVVARFTRAMNASLEYSQSHPKDVRAAVQKFLEVPKSVADRMALPQWSTARDASTLSMITGLLKDQGGLLKKDPNLDQLLPQAG